MGNDWGMKDPFIYTKICPICGKEFKTDRTNRKYCSAECTVKSQRLSHKRYMSRRLKEEDRIGQRPKGEFDE